MDNSDEQNIFKYNQKQSIKKIPSITDQVLYVNQHTNLDNHELLQLSTTSWADQIEEEIGNSINDEPLTGSNNLSSWKDAHDKQNNVNTEIVEKKSVDTDLLITEPIDDKDDVYLLNNQTIIINNLRKTIKNHVDKYLQNKDQPIFDFAKCIAKLKWLLSVSKHFSDKLNITIILHTIKGRNIPRSSYKFCDHGHDCEYNYTSKHEGCFAQHYVHNFVYADIKALIDYIHSVNGKEFDDVRFIEIIRCMNTVSYVISHMYEELKSVSHYNDNYANMHRERTPSGKNKKKNKQDKHDKHDKFKQEKKDIGLKYNKKKYIKS